MIGLCKTSAVDVIEKTRIGSLARVGAILTAFSVASIGSAHAVVVGQWNFVLDSGWKSISPGASVGTTPGTTNGEVGLPASIWWDVNRDVTPTVSGLTVGKTDVNNFFGGASGANTANSANTRPGSWVGDFRALVPKDGTGITTGSLGSPNFESTVLVTHHNNVIDQNSIELDQAQLFDQVMLTANIVGAAPANLNALFDVLFEETDNNNPPPGIDDGRDIFLITPPAGVTIVGDTILQPFKYDPVLGQGEGQDYLAHIKLDGLGQLNADECAALGLGNSCGTGLTTQEGVANSFQASFAITAVPLPPAMYLFLSALVGLGVVARVKGKGNRFSV